MVCGPPAATVESDGRVDVLGDRVGRDAANVAQGSHSENRAGPAPERRAPAVLAGLEHAIEEGLLVEARLALARCVLEGVGVVELLGRLDEGEPLILEIAERPHEELVRRDVVGVEDRDEVGVDLLEGMVHVAGLGMLVSRPGQVARAQGSRQARDLGSVAIVEDPCLVIESHRNSGGDRWREDVGRLVVGRYEDSDSAGCDVDASGGR